MTRSTRIRFMESTTYHRIFGWKSTVFPLLFKRENTTSEKWVWWGQLTKPLPRVDYCSVKSFGQKHSPFLPLTLSLRYTFLKCQFFRATVLILLHSVEINKSDCEFLFTHPRRTACELSRETSHCNLPRTYWSGVAIGLSPVNKTLLCWVQFPTGQLNGATQPLHRYLVKIQA